MNKHCVIFAAGDVYSDIDIPSDSLIIAADAGYEHARRLGVTVHLLVGDFDSLSDIPSEVERVTYPADKDYTDTELAINIGIEKGCENFTVVGALGGKRFEHTVSNLQLAAGISKQGLNITLTDGKTVIKAITDGSIQFDEAERGYISVFSFDGNAEGVTLKGLKYELDNVPLACTGTLGVSNEFTEKRAEVSVTHGTLLIIYHRKETSL